MSSKHAWRVAIRSTVERPYPNPRSLSSALDPLMSHLASHHIITSSYHISHILYLILNARRHQWRQVRASTPTLTSPSSPGRRCALSFISLSLSLGSLCALSVLLLRVSLTVSIQVKDFQQMFKKYDSTQDGYLDLPELKCASHSQSLSLSRGHLRVMTVGLGT